MALETRAAQLDVRDETLTRAVRIRADVEVQSTGPVVARMRDGFLAFGGTVMGCRDIEGSIAMVPAEVDGCGYVIVQLDLAHDHQDLRLAGSFALSPSDAERLLERLKPVVAIARLEESAKGDRA